MAVIPNVVAHGLMALDVYNKLESSSVQSAIKNFPRSYLLGSNGPDILYYFKAFPWEDQKENARVSLLGEAVHTTHINDFYNYAFKFIDALNDPIRKEVLTAYLAGHMMHWSLDSLAHPFVFYRGGEMSGNTKYWHYRYESMIDALMVTYVKRKQMKDLNVKLFVDVSEKERRMIASFYQLVLHDVFHKDILAEHIDSAIKTFKSMLTVLYDPHNLNIKYIKMLEKVTGKPWAFSSHSVNAKIDAEFDVLNLAHETWHNPVDFSIKSDASFIDLYNESIDLGVSLICELEDAFKGKRHDFNDVFKNRDYTSGQESGKVMLYFDSIYEK